MVQGKSCDSEPININIRVKEPTFLFTEITDRIYPAPLKFIPDAPQKLFYLGKIENIPFHNAVAIVGSRRMSNYGKQIIDKLFSEILLSDMVIVSGMSAGVDLYAHKKAIEYNIRTIGVLPHSIDYMKNKETLNMYDSVLASGGLILTEYPYGSPPQKWTYIRRNRIVAGLSQCTIVVEARLNSGSLITADYSNKFGRPVFAYPGSIFSTMSLGCNKIIGEYAKPILNWSTVENIMNFKPDADSGGNTNTIINTLLGRQKMSIDELCEETGMDIRKVSVVVTQLLLNGKLGSAEGLYYVI